MAQYQNNHVIFEPASAAVRGMRSAVSPASLPAGYFSQLQNIRFDELQLKVRQGLSQLTPSAPVDPSGGGHTPTYRGAFSGSLQGTQTIIAAYQFGTGNPVSLWNLNTSTYAWTEITHDGSVDARNGNTRLTTGIAVAFAVVKDTSGKEILIAQNGTDYPRIYDPSQSVHEQVAIHQPITPPTVTSTQQVLLDFPSKAPIWQANRVGVVYGNNPGTAGSLIMADIGSADNLAAQMTIGTSVASGNYSVFDWTIGAPSQNIVGARQLIFIVNSTYLGLWNNIKIQLYNEASGANVTVYDPSSPSSLTWPIYVTDVDPANTNTYCVAFSLDGLDTTSLAMTAWTAIRFTWIGGSAPATAQTATFFLIAASGTILGGCEYGISWQNSQSRAESYGQFLTTNTATLQATAGTPNNGLTLPNSELLYYSATVNYQNVAASEIQNGTDTLNIYRQDAGELTYDLAESITVNNFVANAWVTTNAGALLTQADTTATSNKTTTRILPDAYHLPIPTGTCMVVSNGRLFVGGVGAAKADAWISGYNYPCRFRQTVKFLSSSYADPYSPTVLTFPGERVTGFTIITGSLIGVNVVAAFTDRSIWMLNGFDATSLSAPSHVDRHGCPYPGTIGNHLNAVYWVDEERQIRRYSGGQVQVISRNKVDDKLLTATLTNAAAAVANERYYLAYQPFGVSAQTHILIYEELYGEFCEDVLAAGDATGLVTVDTQPLRVIYAFSGSGLVYQTETPGQNTDAGTPITVSMTTPLLHDRLWNRITAGAVGIVADVTPSTLTITRNWMNKLAGVDGTITLSNAALDTAWLWETCTDNVQAGGSGLGVSITLTGTLPAGNQIYSLCTVLSSSGASGASPG